MMNQRSSQAAFPQAEKEITNIYRRRSVIQANTKHRHGVTRMKPK